MTSTADASAESNTVYRFPERLLYIEVILFSLISTFMIFAWIPLLISFFTYGKIIMPTVRIMIFVNITVIALMMLFFFFKRELKKTEFFLNGDYLCRRNSSGIVKLPLGSLNAVSMIHYPFGSGAVLFESGGGTLVVPLLLRQAEMLFSKLEAACLSASAGQYNARLWKRIHVTEQLSSLVDKRSRRYIGRVLGLCISMLPLNIAIGAFFWDMALIPLAVWTVSGPLFPLVGYAAADIFIRHREHAALDASRGVLAAGTEEKALARSGWVMAILYMVTGILYRMIVQ